MDIYSAIHKAADHIEAHPEEFSFMSTAIPGSAGCGMPGCALGWISTFLGYRAGHSGFNKACDDMGLEASLAPSGWGIESKSYTFYHRMDDIGERDWEYDNVACAASLRAYAERYHAPTTPDWNALATPDDNIREVTT